jgi:hypothetical protein
MQPQHHSLKSGSDPLQHDTARHSIARRGCCYLANRPAAAALTHHYLMSESNPMQQSTAQHSTPCGLGAESVGSSCPTCWEYSPAV